VDFNLYKPRLIDYLKQKGIDAKPGLIRCFNPAHDDKTPSCELFEDHFVCYSGSCGIHGDIYDAVEVLEGITDKREQYLEIEKTFGAAPRPVVPKETEKSFTPDRAACDEVEAYMRGHVSRDHAVRLFLEARARAKDGEGASYPAEIVEKMVNYFFYWPGLDIATEAVTRATLRSAGIPLVNPQKGYSTWDPAGVVVKLSVGYKLHYYRDGECKKINSRAGCVFPTPSDLDTSKPVVLVEGEIDAIACRAAGIDNVYSTGGTNGLTGPKVKARLLEAHEIILCFDNDEPGKKSMGIIPISKDDKNRVLIPSTLRKNGFTGIIKTTHVPDPYKDSDDAVRHGRADLVIKAIEEASIYAEAPVSEPAPAAAGPGATPGAAEAANVEPHGRLSLKELKGVLKKIERTKLDENEVAPFVSACCNILETMDDSAWKILHKWGAPDNLLDRPLKQNPTYLVTIAKKYGLSQYFISRLEAVTISKAELQGMISKNEPIIPLNYKKITESAEWGLFLQNQGSETAAGIIVDILKDCFIYVETEKRHYFYNGHIWVREPDPRGVVYNIFSALLDYSADECGEYDEYTLKLLQRAARKIEQYRFRSEVVLDLSARPQIFRADVLFDSPSIRETLTLEDGVLDFSGKEIKFRKSTQDEYRRNTLPYKVADLKKTDTPEKFMAFMMGNFKDHDTLETLMYYLSLIPSRCTQYKYGGIFIGRPHTGKTTTIELMMKIYAGMIVRLPSEALVSTGRNRMPNNGPSPYVARLEGKGAAVAQETERNGFLNGAFWKELTGGDTLTARGMYSDPRDFTPTAQIIMASNHSPRFDSKDQATIDRMVVIPFRVEHKHGDEGTKEQIDIIADLSPEFPSVIRLFAEYYIRFKHEFKGKIPLSKECAAYKDDYVEDQETDLDRFVEDNIDFVKDENCYEKIKDVYARYLSYYSFELDEFGKPTDKEAFTQNKFTRLLKHDYTEIRVKQKKMNGYPVQIFQYMKLKPDVGQSAQPSLAADDSGSTPKKEERRDDRRSDGFDFSPEPPDDNPFE
jgi:phage/plasmid-associated DNA primase